VEAGVVYQQVEVDLAAWEACAADCAEVDRRPLPLHRHFLQVKGIGGDEEEHRHHPLPEEWV